MCADVHKAIAANVSEKLFNATLLNKTTRKFNISSDTKSIFIDHATSTYYFQDVLFTIFPLLRIPI